MIPLIIIVFGLISLYLGYQMGKNSANANTYMLGFKHGATNNLTILSKLDRQMLEEVYKIKIVDKV